MTRRSRPRSSTCRRFRTASISTTWTQASGRTRCSSSFPSTCARSAGIPGARTMRTCAPARDTTSTPTARTRRRGAATTSSSTAATARVLPPPGNSHPDARAPGQGHDADRGRRYSRGGGAHARRRRPGPLLRHARTAAAEERTARRGCPLPVRQHRHRRAYLPSGTGSRCERLLVGVREDQRAARAGGGAIPERSADPGRGRGAADAGDVVRRGPGTARARAEERLLRFAGHSQDRARGIGEVHRRLGATPDRAVHHRPVVSLFLVERSDGGGVDPRRPGRRRLLPARLAPHWPCPGGGRPRRCNGADPMRRGFTLLEVMISLAILAIALVAISGLNGGAVTMHAYGRRATEATLLLRGKMLDVEDDLEKNGFSDFDDEKHGDFTDDGASAYAWSAEILRPDVRLDPAQLLSLIGGGTQGQGGTSRTGSLASAASALAGPLAGGSGSAPVPSGGAAAALLSGPIGGILQGQATTFIETLKKSVREIRLTVSWSDGKDRRSVSASQIVIILPQGAGPNPALQNTVSPQGGQQVTPRSTQP